MEWSLGFFVAKTAAINSYI